MSSSIGKAYWHIHHDILMEFATEPIRNRRRIIRKYKSDHEIETRLRLLRPVKGSLPRVVIKAWAVCVKAGAACVKAEAACVKAGADYDKAWAAYAKAWVANDKAWADYVKVLKDNKVKIEALHAKECPNCPWDGETIFPKG